ncbi:hypothetical protein [Egicoccus sp. AB-alg6-2]|uniref:hypothetical protein n=1 Tax=Egicoccus sp. AB-alg6-2 TaxID=3242692 RepID=UPI00359DD2E1
MPNDALASLSRIWWVAMATIPLLAALVVATADPESTVPAALPVLLVVLTGAAAIGGAVAADRGLRRQRPSPTEAFATLRSQAFLQLAIAEFPLLLSVALAYVLGPGWVVVVGAVAALAALTVGGMPTVRASRFEALWDLPRGALTTDDLPEHGDADDHDEEPPR